MPLLPLQIFFFFLIQAALSAGLVMYAIDGIKQGDGVLNRIGGELLETQEAVNTLRQNYDQQQRKIIDTLAQARPGSHMDYAALLLGIQQVESGLKSDRALESLRYREAPATQAVLDNLVKYRLAVENAFKTLPTQKETPTALAQQLAQLNTDSVGPSLDALYQATTRIARQDMAEITQATRTQSDQLWSILIAFVAVQGLLMLIVGYALSRPINQLASLALRLAGGDRQAKIPNLGRRDSIGRLANAMQQFKAALVRLDSAYDKARKTTEKFENEMAQRLAAETELRLTASLFENVDEAVVLCDQDFRILRVNSAFTRLFEAAPELVLKQDLQKILFPDDTQAFSALSREVTVSGHWRGELRFVRRNGSHFTALASVREMPDADAQTHTRHRFMLISDISALRQAQQQVVQLSQKDATTDLLNRATFLEVSNRRLNEIGSRPTGLILVGLDRFRAVNDALGHARGDDVLREVARCLQEALPNGKGLARIGGDEFALLLPDVELTEQAEKVVRKAAEIVQSCFESHIEVQGYRFRISASIGGAIYPQDGANLDDALKAAESALAQAKRGGGGQLRLYAESLHSNAQLRFDIQNSLEKALAHNEFELYFQPLIRAANGQLVGFETLIRWNRPGHGMVSPADFIPIAEESGFIIKLTEWVTRHACERLKRWRRQLKAELFMSINIAPRHLMQDDLLKFFTETVKEVGIPPSSLLLEITETGLMESLELVQDRLTEMAMHGFTFAIDDFGTGYSSLANLARLPVNKVKVDRAFLNGIPRDEEAVKLLSSILALSRSLELEVVVEGVESTEQIQFLRQFDNQLLFQGFFFDRPQPEEYWDGVFLKSRLPTYSLTEQQ